MEEKKKILEMLSSGKITVAEAEQLLAALGSTGESPKAGSGEKKSPKYLRIEVQNADDKVNVRVPFNLLRSGVKLVQLMPISIRDQVQNGLEKGGISLDLSKLNSADLDQIVDQLADFQVDVDGKDKVRIYAE